MNKRQRGFSLFEVLVVSIMAAGMALAVASVIRMGLRSWQSSENQMTVSFELRRGIHSMTRELSQTRSDQLEVPGLGAMPADGLFYNSIRFRVPQDVDLNGTVLDAAGALEWTPNQIVYEQDPADTLNLLRSEGLVMKTLLRGLPLAGSLPEGEIPIGFRRFAAPSDSVVEIRVWVQKGAGIPGAPRSGETQPVMLSTRIRLRN